MIPEQNVHPSLLEKATTEKLIKLLKFGLWVDYKIRQNSSESLKDIISKELKYYQNDLAVQDVIQVKSQIYFQVKQQTSPQLFFRCHHSLEQF